jgi:geranylgeranylglycerol-phosphate geranylgeranyltransferase
VNKELIKLLRLNNALIAFVGVWVGAACLLTPLDVIPLLFGSIIFACAAMIGNIHNDIVDLKTDKINRPDRPLVSGKISLSTSITTASILLIALFLYNKYLKQTPLWGNLMVAALCASPMLSILERANFSNELGFTLGFAFILTLTREIVKDIEDFEGDSKSKLNTTAVYFGKKKSRAIVSILLIVSIVGFYLPIGLGWFKSLFPLFAALLLAPYFLITSIRWKSRRMTDKEFSRYLKQVMIAGMISIFADRFWAV